VFGALVEVSWGKAEAPEEDVAAGSRVGDTPAHLLGVRGGRLAAQHAGDASPAGFSPRHRVSLHSLLNLPHHVEIDAILRAVDELPGPGVPAYVTADLRVSWRPRPNLELSIIGRDLFDGHVEFPANDYFQSNGRVVTERTVFGRLRWEF
jgi:hypothetical protein